MRATLWAKRVVLILAAIALIYGILIVLKKNDALMNGKAEPVTSPVAKPVAVADIPSAIASPMVVAPVVKPATKVDDSVQERVKNSVQFLEEGNSAQSLLEMRFAIDMAKAQHSAPVDLDALSNMLMRIEYCAHGPDGILRPELAVGPEVEELHDRQRQHREADRRRGGNHEHMPQRAFQGRAQPRVVVPGGLA